jgi:hypothetical protein
MIANSCSAAPNSPPSHYRANLPAGHNLVNPVALGHRVDRVRSDTLVGVRGSEGRQ